ncbi:hypothetical protein K1T71_008618 [Dendrolimus kikuchii]|uniref:Uncharacterized protein n=1 Tax=Dendrolimus kikuchii TaxID=765133 RepID=A0ACC1CUX2_9NEOP|nr:hypothetical protein K1T71_008618 [Dendrolimus kikuchii]
MYVYYLLLLFDFASWTNAEIYTAISDIEPLLETHKMILDDLNDYIKNIMNASMEHDDMKYPTTEDLVGAAQALTRLQRTYNLHIEELAEGKLNGVTYRLARSNKETLQLYILVLITGHIKEALLRAELLLELDPNHTQVENDILHYKDAVCWPPTIKNTFCFLIVFIKLFSRLKCRYETENHPFLRYAPVKVEEMFIDPTVLIFHDVISNREIEVIQMMAQPRFKRATVRSSETGEGIPIGYRISKSAWLTDDESPIISRISQRVADMTGLDMTHAEELQVANYGIGGHYEPHFDFRRQFEPEIPGQDNRIATVLFYMSDVAQGGATVFPELGLTLYPEKGAAAFWLNLHPSGQGDLATKHAACPVLLGSKWVCNKWIHERGQELIKPCNLEFQDEIILHSIPRPTLKNMKQAEQNQNLK